MKVLLALGLAFGAIVSFAGHSAKAKERQQNATVEQRLSGLGLSLVAHKRRYKRSDQLRLDVMLKNSRAEDVYVFGTLDWDIRRVSFFTFVTPQEKRSNQ
jgi:hypothetical protein